MNEIENTECVITTNTNDLKESVPSKDITEKKKFIRQCKTCGRDIEHDTEKLLKNAIKRSSGNCAKCGALQRHKNHPHNKETCEKISKGLKGKKHSEEFKEKVRNTLKKKFNTPEYKELFSKIHMGKRKGCKLSEKAKENMSKNHADVNGEKNGMFGKKHTEETKLKIREAVLRRTEKSGKSTRGYNPEACKLIEEYGKENGYNFQHAMNGGEIQVYGYRLDCYDKEKNVVIEIDEPYHKRPKQRKKDIERQKRLEEYLKCKFIRLPFNK